MKLTFAEKLILILLAADIVSDIALWFTNYMQG